MADWLPKRLPEDIEAERSLLATIAAPGMEVRAAEIVFRLDEADFVAPQHRALFLAIRALISQESEINALTLRDELDQRDQLGLVGGFAGLTELLASEEVGRPEVLADLLARKARWRNLIKIGARMVREAAEEDGTPEAVGQAVGQEILDLIQPKDGSSGSGSFEAGLDSAVAVVQERRDGRRVGVHTGFPSIDRITHGFQAGHVVILAARPGVGKSTLARNWILHAIRRGVPTALFSLEMSSEEVSTAFLSDYGSISHSALSSGQVNDALMADLLRSRDHLRQMPLRIYDRATTTVPEMRSILSRDGLRGKRVGLVVIDYLQLITSPKDSAAAKQNEAVRVGEISRSLKLMAKDLGVPVVVLSQLNREIEHRSGAIPQLSDLRDSGSIEQDADIVSFIARKTMPDASGVVPPSASFIIAKHRGGPVGSVELYFEGDHCRYREAERTTDDFHPKETPRSGRDAAYDLD